jgi:hypothetical protein
LFRRRWRRPLKKAIKKKRKSIKKAQRPPCIAERMNCFPPDELRIAIAKQFVEV